MNRQRFRKMVIKGIRQFGDPYYQGFAAQIAFFIMLSLVPTFILAGQLLSYLDISIVSVLSSWIDRSHTGNLQSNILDNLQDIITSLSGKNIKGKQTSSPLMNDIILIALALWSASRAQFALMRIANYTYSEGRTTGNFFKERWRSLGTMFLTVCTLAFVAAPATTVYGKAWSQYRRDRVHDVALISLILCLFLWWARCKNCRRRLFANAVSAARCF